MSKLWILCPTRMSCPAKSRNPSRAVFSAGASRTMLSVMPLMREAEEGIFLPGFTRVEYSPAVFPSRTLMPEISIISSWRGDNPVVSRSNTT